MKGCHEFLGTRMEQKKTCVTVNQHGKQDETGDGAGLCAEHVAKNVDRLQSPGGETRVQAENKVVTGSFAAFFFRFVFDRDHCRLYDDCASSVTFSEPSGWSGKQEGKDQKHGNLLLSFLVELTSCR